MGGKAKTRPTKNKDEAGAAGREKTERPRTDDNAEPRANKHLRSATSSAAV